MPPRIILATLNAKYIHASLGLRYLLANMARHGGADLRAMAVLREFTIRRPVQEVADALLQELGPPTDAVQVVGLGVYIWNVQQTTALVRLLKAQRPQLRVVLGGPEVSHELDTQDVVSLADHVITGWGDVSFPQLCKALVHGPQPLMKVIAGVQPPLDEIALPYDEYDAADLAHRVLYVEASRGCPFKCEFCLSALDKTAWAFDADQFLAALAALYQRGARNFKFVDRTFNLKIDASVRILQFFLDRMAALLKARGVRAGKLVGGTSSILVFGFPPKQKNWKVNIFSPYNRSSGETLATVFLRDESLSTSTASERYVEWKGRKYGHIFDPRTGYPAETDLVSVTVVAPDAAWSDALSTAFFVMGSKKVWRFCEEHPGLRCVLVSDRDRTGVPVVEYVNITPEKDTEHE